MSSQLLMIEDDARLAQMVGEYLGQSGMQVLHCADGSAIRAQLVSIPSALESFAEAYCIGALGFDSTHAGTLRPHGRGSPFLEGATQ